MYSYYQMPDSDNPLSWGAVRENIERRSNESFLKNISNLASKSAFKKIQSLFLRKPSLSNSYTERPGFIEPNKIERPGFIR